MGDHFWQGGTNFGCQNQSGWTNFGSQNWSGRPVFLPKLVSRTDLGRDRFWRDRALPHNAKWWWGKTSANLEQFAEVLATYPNLYHKTADRLKFTAMNECWANSWKNSWGTWVSPSQLTTLVDSIQSPLQPMYLCMVLFYKKVMFHHWEHSKHLYSCGIPLSTLDRNACTILALHMMIK